MLELRILQVGQFETNCYLLVCPSTKRALLIDPGGEPERVLEMCRDAQVDRIALTHGHTDHILGLEPVREELGAETGIHPADAAEFDIQADFGLQEGTTLQVGRHRVRVTHIPGHTPGGVAFRFDTRAIVGDAIFPGGPGHSRTPEDLELLLQGLQRTVFAWPDETTFYPGHGASSTVGTTRPAFQAFLARPRSFHLCGDVTWERERPALATRTDLFIESAIAQMTLLGNEVGAIKLSQGLPDFEPPEELLEAALEALRGDHNQYTPTLGLPEFCQAVADKTRSYNRIPTDADSMVTITVGVSEAINAAILALTDPGDEVVIMEPWYENYVPAAMLADVVPRFVPLREPDYAFDPGELAQAFSDRTRLVLVNSPHNPTGRVFTREELQIIAGLCQEYDVVAVTDEIYEYILYDGREHVSLGSLPGMEERTVTCSGIGKTYVVTGWRVGWTVAAAPLTRLIRKVHDYLTICAPTPFQQAGLVALALPDEYHEQIRAEYSARRDILLEGLTEVGMTYRRPEGAYYLMADCAPLGWQDDWAFAEYLGREIGVTAVPGTGFYHGPEKHTTRLRFNFAKRRETLEEALRRMRRMKPRSEPEQSP